MRTRQLTQAVSLAAAKLIAVLLRLDACKCVYGRFEPDFIMVSKPGVATAARSGCRCCCAYQTRKARQNLSPAPPEPHVELELSICQSVIVDIQLFIRHPAVPHLAVNYIRLLLHHR
jgi:hypothetical protein